LCIVMSAVEEGETMMIGVLFLRFCRPAAAAAAATGASAFAPPAPAARWRAFSASYRARSLGATSWRTESKFCTGEEQIKLAAVSRDAELARARVAR
jgi:hypothetical protein